MCLSNDNAIYYMTSCYLSKISPYIIEQIQLNNLKIPYYPSTKDPYYPSTLVRRVSDVTC